MDLVVIGDGGHAQDIRTWAWKMWPQYRGNQEPPRMLHHHTDWDGVTPFVIGINDPQIRYKVANELGCVGLDGGRWFHPHAHAHGYTKIEAGVHVNYASHMTRTTIDEFSTIAPGVIICGDVTIGKRVFIGAGAVIRNLVTIGDDAFICMGSVVTRDVVPGEKYKGRT